MKPQVNIFLTENTRNKRALVFMPGVSPVPGAVHGFEGEGLLLRLKWKHVLTIVLPVAGRVPQLAVVDVGGHDLLETPLPVLALPETQQSVRQQSFSSEDSAAPVHSVTAHPLV